MGESHYQRRFTWTQFALTKSRASSWPTATICKHLAAVGQAVLDDRVAHIRVEYDSRFTGGDYSGIRSFVLVSQQRIDEAVAELGNAGLPNDGDAAIRLAFRKQTTLDPMHIIHVSADETFNQYGELISV